MKNNRGIIQIPIIIGLVALAIVIPVARKMTLNKNLGNGTKNVANNVEKTETSKEVKSNKAVEAEIKLEPATFTVKQGEKKKIRVIIDTSISKRKVDIARIVLCWQEGLGITNYEEDVVIDKDSFSSFVFKKPAKYNGLDCIDMVVNSQNTTDKLKSGKLVAADIMLSGVAKSSGIFSVDSSLTEVSGPAGTDGVYSFQLGEIEKYNYQVN